jgi:hypothetical protein
MSFTSFEEFLQVGLKVLVYLTRKLFFLLFLYNPVLFLRFNFLLPFNEITVRATDIPGPLAFVNYLDMIKTMFFALFFCHHDLPNFGQRKNKITIGVA